MGLINAIILHAKLRFATKLESYENYYKSETIGYAKNLLNLSTFIASNVVTLVNNMFETPPTIVITMKPIQVVLYQYYF